MSAENGGHRIQRIPPTERKGRVHSSTVTVSVTDKSETISINLIEKDLSYSWYSGSGAGGQHRNKHQNCLRLTHLPSNITVSAQSRKREANVRSCKAELTKRLSNLSESKGLKQLSVERLKNHGTGMRSDKTYTIRFQDNSAVRHSTGRRISCKKYMSGRMDLLW